MPFTAVRSDARHDLELRSVKDLADAESISRSLRWALGELPAGHAVRLGLSSLDTLSLRWGTVVANLLAAEVDREPLTVELPAGNAAQARLARSGLLYAIARRQTLSAPEATEHALERWKRDWEPRSKGQADFNYPSDGDPTTKAEPYDERLLAFLNPTRFPLEVSEAKQQAVIHPWMRKMLPSDTREDGQVRDELLRNVGHVAWELLSNTKRHAQLGHRDLSSLSLSLQRKTTQVVLNVVVHDTGVGMPAALAVREQGVAAATSIERSFAGKLTPGPRGEGRGLRRVLQLLQSLKGEAGLFVASGSGDGGAVVVDWKPGHGRLRASAVSLPLQGTVTVVTLPVGSTDHWCSGR